jgi:hypothetical protein
MTPDEIQAKLAELAKLQAELQAQLPPPPIDEPPDIRKTNASDDICPACQRVHTKDPNVPLECRCLYCGQIGLVAVSTYDSRLGFGIVCQNCCRGAGPRDFQRIEAEALARGNFHHGIMPWDS